MLTAEILRPVSVWSLQLCFFVSVLKLIILFFFRDKNLFVSYCCTDIYFFPELFLPMVHDSLNSIIVFVCIRWL